MENINQIPNLQSIQPVEPVKNQNIFKYLFIASIFIFLAVIISFYFLLNNKINQINNKQTTEITPILTQTNTNNELIPTIKKVSIDPTQILNQLQATLKTSSPITTRNVSWIDQNSQNIPLIGQGFGLAGTVSNNYVSKYGNYSDLESITIDSFKNLQSDIDSFFKSDGFEKDKANTINYATNRLNTIEDTIVVGYIKNETKCLITLSAQTDPFGDFFCGVIDEKRAPWVKELSPLFNPTNDPNTLVYVDKMIDDYVSGSTNSRYGGGIVWIAQKIDGIWKKVWIGQDTISCSVVNQYQIPKEIYGTCQ